MITLMILTIIAILVIAAIVIVFSILGAGAILIAGDWIVCVVIIGYLIYLIVKRWF